MPPAAVSDRAAAPVTRRPLGPHTSALVFDGELAIGGQEHFYLETQCAIAWLDETAARRCTPRTQHPSETQDVVARVLGVHRNQVTVECLRMGGAFGGKEVQANPFAAIAALGAWKTGRPVRVRLTRELDIAMTGKRHPYLARYAAGFATDGRIEALRLRPLLRRRLEPRPVRAGHVALAVSLRQRLSAAGRRGHRPRLPHSQDLADRISRIWRATGDARHRRHPVAGARHRLSLPPDRRARAQPSIATAIRPITGRRSATRPAGASSGASSNGRATSRPAAPAIDAFNAAHPHASAAWRSRR